MGQNANFFDKKREWSRIKDRILLAYLPPYLAKMHRTKCATTVADCFAGKGRFDDGEIGSPLIICNAIHEQLCKAPATRVNAVFIENKYAQELSRNLGPRNYAKILEGNYEERIENFINMSPAISGNLLLYIDPYGIKSLRMAHFREISKLPLNSFEALINFNAHGFLREGCRLLKGHILHGDSVSEEYEPDVSSPEMLDDIAGGKYWRPILEKYYESGDLHEAEDALVDGYCSQLREIFQYVLQIPVKAKLNHIAKYRMIFGTNHEDGLILMADNMHKRWDEYRKEARDQDVLFEMDYPDRKMAPYGNAREVFVMDLLSKRLELRRVLVRLFEEFGICFSKSQHIAMLKEMDAAGAIQVERIPSKTTTGRSRIGWEHKSPEYKVFLEKGDQQWQPNLI